MSSKTRARRLCCLCGKRSEPSEKCCPASSEMREKAAAPSPLLCDTAEDVHEGCFHLLRKLVSQMPQQSRTLSPAVPSSSFETTAIRQVYTGRASAIESAAAPQQPARVPLSDRTNISKLSRPALEDKARALARQAKSLKRILSTTHKRLAAEKRARAEDAEALQSEVAAATASERPPAPKLQKVRFVAWFLPHSQPRQALDNINGSARCVVSGYTGLHRACHYLV